MPKQKKYTFIDLFAGCGGLSEGFLSSNRFQSLAHVEWEIPMVDTLRNRLVQRWGYSKENARKDVVLFDIQRTEELINGNWEQDVIDLYGAHNSETVINNGLKGIVGRRKVDLIIGGPPCQAYSIHGRATDKNSMQDDYRNYLFESFVKVVSAFKPKVFVFENVPGILTAKPGGRNVTERIYDAFTEAGYKIRKPAELKNSVFNAVDFYVPQNRPRVIIVGVRNDIDIELDSIYQSIATEKSNGPQLTVRDAIGGLPKIMPLKESVKQNGGTISHKVINPDNSITQHNPRFQGQREVSVFREWILRGMNKSTQKEKIDFYYNVTGHTTLYAKYKNLEWDKPSHTVVAHLCKDGYMFIHPDPEQSRSITIREAALLMSFPMDYQFIAPNSICYKMIGNAVPVLFAKSIANGIVNILDK